MNAIACRRLARVRRADIVVIVAILFLARRAHAVLTRIVLCALVTVFANVSVTHRLEGTSVHLVALVVRTRIAVVTWIRFADTHTFLTRVILGAHVAVVARNIRLLVVDATLVLDALVERTLIAVVANNVLADTQPVRTLVRRCARRTVVARNIDLHMQTPADRVARVLRALRTVLAIQCAATLADMTAIALVDLRADIAVIARRQRINERILTLSDRDPVRRIAVPALTRLGFRLAVSVQNTRIGNDIDFLTDILRDIRRNIGRSRILNHILRSVCCRRRHRHRIRARRSVCANHDEKSCLETIHVNLLLFVCNHTTVKKSC